MVISGSQLELSAQRTSYRLVEQETSLRVWTRAAEPPSQTVSTPSESSAVREAEGAESTFLSLNAMILERFFGIKIKVIYPEEMGESSGTEEAAGNRVSAQNWGMEISRHTRVVSEDTLDFQAAGKVITADGREIEFSLDLSLSRHLEADETISIRYGEAQQSIDPLVLQLRPGNMEMSDQSFAFDLDGDGTAESVPVLGSGSYLLALDRNGDQQINDGRELFGPASGQGFSELASLDQDGNRWIDEGDEAFFSLRLWQPDSEGKGTLLSLNEAGVGAVSIDAVASSWDLNRASLVESGVFLTEAGQVGHLGELLFHVGPLEA